MNKFKKWLIHKLGGMTLEDTPPKPQLVVVESGKIRTITATTDVSPNVIERASREGDDYLETYTWDCVENRLLKELKPYIKHSKGKAFDDYIQYKAEIKILIKEEEQQESNEH